MKSMVLLVVALAAILGYTQAPDTLWTKTYGGPNSDSALSVQETMDGGYIIAGTTTDFGGGLRNIWLLKTDVNGDTTWTNTFGGGGDHYGRCVRQTSDSGYIVTGGTADLSQIADVIIIKTDPNGNASWTSIFGGTEFDIGNSVCETSDGGYVAVGMTRSFSGIAEIYVVKTDANGDSLWTRTYGGPLWDEAHSVQETADSGLIITGYTTLSSGPGGPDTEVYLLKTDANGNSIWSQTYELNAAEEYRDYGYSVQQTSDNGYILVGETWYPGTPAWEIDVYLVKTHPNGDTIWTRTYDRAARTDKGLDVQQTNDGGYIIAGYTQIIGLDYDIYLIRTDANGDTVWTKTIGDAQAPTPWEEAFALDQTSDGGYIIAGFTHSYGAGSSDIWIVKTEPEVGVEEYESQHPTPFSLHVSPNPFKHTIHVRFTIHNPGFMIEEAHQDIRGSVGSISEYQKPELKIYDATGRLIKSFDLESCILDRGSKISWDGTDQANRRLGSGVYFVKLQTGDYTTTEKALLIR
jgi:hypothetical protein